MAHHWMTFRQHCPIGIDLCASGAKLVQLYRQGSQFGMVATARVDMPAPPPGQAASPSHLDDLCTAIKQRVDSSGFVGSRCVLSIEDRELRVRSVRQPSMPPEELKRAIALEAPSRLGFGENEAAEFGWISAGEVTQGEARGQEVILVGARSEPIQHIVMALARRGLKTLAVEPGFVAGARSFTRFIRRASEQHDVHAVVDMGQRSTGVMLLRGQNIAFFKPLEIGGEMLTRAAAERLGLDIEAVQEVRRQLAGAESGSEEQTDPKVDRAMFEAVRPLMGELAREVGLCMRYYSVTFRGSRPKACLVVGGEAQTPHLVDVLGEELRVETKVGEPLRAIRAVKGDGLWTASRGAGGEWAVATGASLRLWEQRLRGRGWRRPAAQSTLRRSDGIAARVQQDGRRAA